MNYPKRSQKSKISMQVRCEALNKIFYKDYLSPFMVLKTLKGSKDIEEVWRSKTIEKTFNPVFQEVIEVHYSFEGIAMLIFLENTRYIFEVYHETNPESPIAMLKTTVKELLSAPNGMLVRELDTGFKKGGKITICFQLIKSYNSFFSLKLETLGLPSSFWKNLFGVENILLKIEKKWQDHSKVLFVSQSQPYNEHLQWDSVQVQFSGSVDEVDSKIRFSLCKQSPNPVASFGVCQFQWNKLSKDFQSPFLNTSGEKQGQLVVQQCKYKTEHSFCEFIEAGLNFNFSIGIDFSASIVPASNHRSPHYTGKGDSFYMNVLSEVAEFLFDYTPDQKVGVYSVGAIPKFPKIYSGNKVDQCFPINEDHKDPRIQGIESLRERYNYAVKHLQFSGPTDFRQVIKRAMVTCLDRKKEKEEYTVLVILTDGKLNNISQIQTLLGQCSTLPLYIVFLGIDGSSKQLENLAKMKMEVYTSEKDLVYRENMINYGFCSRDKGNIGKVVRQVFTNLPDVVSRYMNLRKKTPQKLKEFLSHKQIRKLSQSPTNSDNFNPQL